MACRVRKRDCHAACAEGSLRRGLDLTSKLGSCRVVASVLRDSDRHKAATEQYTHPTWVQGTHTQGQASPLPSQVHAMDLSCQQPAQRGTTFPSSYCPMPWVTPDAPHPFGSPAPTGAPHLLPWPHSAELSCFQIWGGGKELWE